MAEDRRSRARPDYHDPTAGIGGASPAHSALTLRLVLAGFGLLVCAGGVAWSVMTDGPPWMTILLGVLTVVAVLNILVVARRKARGEPG
jgi:hypothetical protein